MASNRVGDVLGNHREIEVVLVRGKTGEDSGFIGAESCDVAKFDE